MQVPILSTLALVVMAQGIFNQAFAQSEPAFPSGALAMEAKFLERIGSQTRAWIRQEGARVNRSDTISQETAVRAVASNRSLRGLGGTDVDALAFLVMMEAARSAREDLKAIMDGVKQLDRDKASARQAVVASRSASASVRARMRNDVDSLTRLGEMESLRLQVAMDRQAKLMSTLSNLMKKVSDTGAPIIQNLK